MATAGANDPKIQRKIEKLKKQLLADSNSKVFVELAEEYAKVGMLSEAALVLQDGLKVYPAFITALVALGKLYMQLDQPTNARDVFQEAVKVSPDNLVAHRTLARIYANDGAWEAARRSCEIVLFTVPKDKQMLAVKAELEPRDAASASTPPPEPAELHPPTPAQAHSAEDASQSQPLEFRPAEARTPEPETTPSATSARPAPPDQASKQAYEPKVAHLRALLEQIRDRRAS